MFDRSISGWVLLTTIILLIILVPFFLFGEQVEKWTDDFVESASDQPGLVALVLGLLLAVDILVPVPSSLVSTAAGFVLGFGLGTLTSLIGMTISCAFGFWLGATFGRPVAERLVGEAELMRLQELSQRFGNWAIAVSRPMPVLAEASILFAGMSRMSVYAFLLLSTLSNLGISAAYAAVGAYSASLDSFLLAFGGAILVPLLAMLMIKGGQNRVQADKEI